MIGQILDTALNVTVFAYLGFLIWLATRPSPDP